jgi:hypothetical protein
MIKKPLIGEGSWDGSHVFRVPSDPNIRCFVGETFIEARRASKVKGMQIQREAFDPAQIRI